MRQGMHKSQSIRFQHQDVETGGPSDHEEDQDEDEDEDSSSAEDGGFVARLERLRTKARNTRVVDAFEEDSSDEPEFLRDSRTWAEDDDDYIAQIEVSGFAEISPVAEF